MSDIKSKKLISALGYNTAQLLVRSISIGMIIEDVLHAQRMAAESTDPAVMRALEESRKLTGDLAEILRPLAQAVEMPALPSGEFGVLLAVMGLAITKLEALNDPRSHAYKERIAYGAEKIISEKTLEDCTSPLSKSVH